MFVEKLRMDGKTVMVVGAGGGGHGTATCVALAEAGARIIAVDISARNLEEVEQRVESVGAAYLGLIADVTRKADVERMVATAGEQCGAIHGLVNIVGGTQQGQYWSLLDYPEQVFDDTINLNLRSAFLTCQAVARDMVSSNIAGSLVNVSSVSSLPTAPSHALYGAAKSALNALSRTMALEWSAHGIRVNIVAPGNMMVPRVARLGGMDAIKTYEDAINQSVSTDVVPLGRWGTASDIGSAILFLLSDMAAYVTGQLLMVDGGLAVKSISTGTTIRSIMPGKK